MLSDVNSHNLLYIAGMYEIIIDNAIAQWNIGGIMRGNQPEYDSNKVAVLSGTVLEGKRVLFLGSSVTFGAASLEDGIPEYFRQRFGCSITKEAVSGTTLVDKDDSSYVSRLLRNIDTEKPYDLFICQLSTNDATQGLALGEISSSLQIEKSEASTITGAMEYIISYVREKWGCPIYFYTGSRYESAAYEMMVKRLYELSEKWGIGVLDLWNSDSFNAISDDDRALYMADPIHPTKAGYMKWWCPEMERQLLNNTALFK